MVRSRRAVMWLVLAAAWAPAQTNWVDPDRSEPAGMKYRTFHSDAIQGEVSYLIYLPPSYEQEPERRYPALYFLHGRGGNQRGAAWVVQRLSRAIAAKQAPEMIVAGVNGLPFSSYVDSADGKTPVQTILIQEMIPHVDRTYRTIAKREARILEGFSMGGAGAAKIGFKYPELFGVVSILAGALHDAESIAARGDTFQTIYGGSKEYFDANSPWNIVEKNAAPIRNRTFVRIAVGSRDNLLERNRKYHEVLDKLGIRHEFHVIDGVAHAGAPLYEGLGEANWKFFRRALAGEVGDGK